MLQKYAILSGELPSLQIDVRCLNSMRGHMETKNLN